MQFEAMRKRMTDDEHHKRKTEDQERKAEERKRVLDDWYRNKFKQIQQIGGGSSDKGQSILKQQHQKRPGGRRLESLDTVIAQNPTNFLIYDFPDPLYSFYYFVGSGPFGLKLTLTECVDCRVKGGVTGKPAFWQ